MDPIRKGLLTPLPPDRLNDGLRDRWRKIRYSLFVMTPFLGRKRRRGETAKARSRREREGFFETYCRGRGLDIGYGGDPVVPGVRGWDFEHGDATELRGVPDSAYDFVHSSHLLEHVVDCERTLERWWRAVRPGGHLLLYVPHRDLYEKRKTLPSRFNEDHKHFFLPDRDEPPDTVGIAPLIERALTGGEIVYCRTCDANYANPGDELHSAGEYSIEAVIRKLPAES